MGEVPRACVCGAQAFIRGRVPGRDVGAAARQDALPLLPAAHSYDRHEGSRRGYVGVVYVSRISELNLPAQTPRPESGHDFGNKRPAKEVLPRLPRIQTQVLETRDAGPPAAKVCVFSSVPASA